MFDPPADRFGRTLLIAIAVWGSLAGVIYLVLTLVFQTQPPTTALTPSKCNPSVAFWFDSSTAVDPAAPAVNAHSRCDATVSKSSDPNAVLRAYLDGAELDAAPHEQPPVADAALLARGGELFGRHCAGCHGITGDGTGANACAIDTQPANLMKGIYALRTTEHEALPTDEDIFRTITRGIHGTAMPPWGGLAERERWALVAYVKTLSKQFTEDVAPPSMLFGPVPDATPERIARGRALYLGRGCESCHGDAGHGDGLAATALTTKPRDFTSGRFHRGSSTGDIHATLVTGLDGTPMGSFAKVMSSDELWDVSLYVSRLTPQWVDREGIRCPESTLPRNVEELFGVRNLMSTLRPAPVADR